MYKPKIIHTAYIIAEPADIWDALTNSEMTRQYFFDMDVEAGDKVGATVKYVRPDGTLDVQGEILEWQPPHRMSMTWQVRWDEAFRQLPAAVVAFQIDPLGEVTRLTVTESHQEPIDERVLEGSRRGWPVIVSGLKTLLETGRPLPTFDMSDLREAMNEVLKLLSRNGETLEEARR